MVNYIDLEKLVKSIETKIEKLKNGEINDNELIELQRESNNLNERINVIKYLYFKKVNIQDDYIIENTNINEFPIFDFSKNINEIKENTDSQISESNITESSTTNESLEDKKDNFIEKELISDTEIVDDKIILDNNFEKLNPLTNVKIKEKNDNQSSIDDLSDSKTNYNESLKITEDLLIRNISEKKSINDMYAESRNTITFADQASQSRVAELKESIPIHKKYQFMNELFDGEKVYYEEQIDLLNKLPNYDSASKYLQELSLKFSWNIENNTTKDFINLVLRKFK